MFHILVVEDDQALNKLICRVLNKNGYETASATDGEEALALLDQMYIDLIITDLMMPKDVYKRQEPSSGDSPDILRRSVPSR